MLRRAGEEATGPRKAARPCVLAPFETVFASPFSRAAGGADAASAATIISGGGHRRGTNQTAERPEWARKRRWRELGAVTEQRYASRSRSKPAHRAGGSGSAARSGRTETEGRPVRPGRIGIRTRDGRSPRADVPRSRRDDDESGIQPAGRRVSPTRKEQSRVPFGPTSRAKEA